MTNNTILIAVGGYARTGKDTMYELIARYSEEFLNLPCRKLKFAGALKEQVREECMEKFGIDSFTEKDSEKEIIRPLLVETGRKKREEDVDYWAKQVLDQSRPLEPGVNVITDLRFENELKVVLDYDPEATVLILDKPGIGPINSEEAKMTSPLYRTQYVYHWKSTSGKPWEEMSPEEQKVFFASVLGDLYLITPR